MEASAFRAVLAALPIALILFLMLYLRWTAARAGLLALTAAVLIAYNAFGFRAAQGYAGVAAEGGFLAATILWILWPALALQHWQQQSGAIDRMRAGMARMSQDKFVQVLFVAWFFALFFEGAAGFGTPVALAAPLLVGLGVPPVRAVVMALLGHAVGVSFGALGTPVLAQAGMTAVDASAIAWRTALLHLALGWILMVFLLRNFEGAGVARLSSPRAAATWAVTACMSFLLCSLALAAMLGPELPTLGGAMAGCLLFAFVVKGRGAAKSTQVSNDAPAGRWLGNALLPYVVLVALVLATRLVPRIADAANSVVLEWQLYQSYRGAMYPLTHPGTLLLGALLLATFLQNPSRNALVNSLRHSAKRLIPVAIALLAMLWLSRLMLHAGLIQSLEGLAVRSLGKAWPLVAPAVGAVGSFITGSATASNVLFTSLQAQTAQTLDLPVAWMLAAQCVGAAVGNVVCPHNIVAGAATVGATGRESEILRQTLVPCACYLMAGGLLLLLVVVLMQPQ